MPCAVVAVTPAPAVPELMVPVALAGYTFKEFAPLLKTTTLCPTGTSGSFTPVLRAAVVIKLTKFVSAVASATVVPAAVMAPEEDKAGEDDTVSKANMFACSGGIPKPIKSERSGIKSP